MSQFSHLDDRGQSRMVDVGSKPITERLARGIGLIRGSQSTIDAIFSQSLDKGNVLEVARLAGIMAGKKTAELIPLCHQIAIHSIEIAFRQRDRDSIEILSTVRASDRTGVEMEALTAVSIAALTIYDMCKSVDRAMRIDGVQLLEKMGGKSGHYRNETALESDDERS